MKAPPSLSRTA